MRKNQGEAGCAPAEDLEVGVGVGDALPDTLKLGLHAHGEGHNDPAALQVDGRAAIVGDVAQHQDLDAVVRERCSSQTRDILRSSPSSLPFSACGKSDLSFKPYGQMMRRHRFLRF